MMRRIPSIAQLICVSLVLFITSSILADGVATGYKAVVSGPVNSNSFFTLSGNPSNTGLNSESVNLFTGQFKENIPLLSLDARGGSGISISLDYSSAVVNTAKKENRYAQASPFGLGFSVGRQFIVADHKSTTDAYDDSYQLVMNGTAYQLKFVENNRYITDDGKPWLIYRHTALVNGYDMVIGWTIHIEDGTIYKYGDFDQTLSEYDATRYVLHYGTYVGNGVTNDDLPFPYTWDISEVTDPEELNTTVFHYSQDPGYLKVMNASNVLVNSTYSYTRASYLSSITTPDQASVEFEYSPRTDYFASTTEYTYYFYNNKKAEKISVLSANNEVQSVIKFQYDYITNSYNDPEFQKLVLTQIDNFNGDESDKLPPTSFEYITLPTDPAYGAMQKIHYSSGSIKEMHYSELSASENITQLKEDLNLGVSAGKQHVGSNVIVNMSDDASKCKIAYWDGRWHTYYPNNYWYYSQYQQPANINYGLKENDKPGVNADGWVAVYSWSLQSLLVWRWKGGYFEIDTLTTPFTPGSSDRVKIYPTKNAFVVVSGGYGSDGNNSYVEKIKTAYYYRWNGTDWDNYHIYTFSEHIPLASVQVSDNVFGLSYYVYDDGYLPWLMYGAYDPVTDAVVIGTSNNMYLSYLGNKFTVGPNNVCFIGYGYESWEDWWWGDIKSYVSLNKFENSQWTNQTINYPENAWRIGRAIKPFPNGVVFAIDNGDNGHQSFLNGAFYTSTGWKTTSFRLSYDNANRQVGELHTGNHYALGQIAANSYDDVYLWEWGGTNFYQKMRPITSTHQSFAGEVFTDSYAWGPKATAGASLGPIYGRQHLGDGNWTSRILSTPTNRPYKYSASDNYVICNMGTASSMFLYQPFYNGIASNYIRYDVQATQDGISRFYATGDVFFIEDDLPTGAAHQAIYKLIDTTATGYAQIVKVDSVSIYEYEDDADPLRIRYAYYKGSVGPDGTTPRFCKAEVSTPYYAHENSPEGWTVSYFYNDTSEITISDGHYASSVTMPDLQENEVAPFYGVRNGGYLLDGKPYLTYSYTSGYDETENVDYTLYKYQLFTTPDAQYVPDVYRIQLVETNSKTDGVATKEIYTYNSYSGLPISKISTTYLGEISPGNPKHIYTEYKQYAFMDQVDVTTAQAMKADNALSQVLDVKTYYNYNMAAPLTAAGKRYAKHGNWVPVEEFTWRDFSNETDTLFTKKITEFDTFGNQTVSINATDLKKSIKYDTESFRPIATGADCTPLNLIVQDFEQGTTWDGWQSWNIGSYHSFDTDAFTGEYSFKLTDNPNVLAHNWSPVKEVYWSDLAVSDMHFSAWVKGNHILRVFCFVFDSQGIECRKKTLEFNVQNEDSWEKIDGDFTSIFGGGCFAGTTIKFRWILVDEEGNEASPDSYIKIDNIRIHPATSHVKTTVYDENAGLITANLDLNNIPIRYEYDSFLRLSGTKNFKDDYISKKSIKYGSVSNLVEVIADNSHGTDQYYSFVVEQPQTIAFDYSAYINNYIDVVTLRIYKNGSSIYYYEEYRIQGEDLPYYYNGHHSFIANAGDLIEIYAESGNSSSSMACSMNVMSYEYTADNPNFVRTASYSMEDGTLDSIVTIAYYNSLGDNIQNRTLNYLDDGITEAALVSNVSVRDGRGRVIRAYNEYLDLVGPSGLNDFTPLNEVLTEANTYYNGTNDYSCQGYPYSEMEYDSDIKGRLNEVSQTGADWRMTSGHTSLISYDEFVDNTRQLFVKTTVDPDGNTSKFVNDSWNRIAIDTSFYTDSQNNPAKVIQKRYKNVKNEVDSVVFSDGVNEYTLRKFWYNDLGLKDSMWVIDYGTVKMMYDKHGNVRYEQNDKSHNDNKLIYHKYDKFGRKIEEGIADTFFFSQQFADLPGLPQGSVKYRWQYDRNDTLVDYGKTLFISNADSSYYKKYYRFPLDYKDSVVTKLLISQGDEKSIVHKYDERNGQLEYKTIYPYESSVGARSTNYVYDELGRVNAVQERAPDGSALGYIRNYSEYEYYVDGRIKRKLLGMYESASRHDTVQVMNYTYNALGKLTAINDTSAVIYPSGGIGEANTQFALQINYTDGGAGYYNGQVASIATSNSTNTYRKVHTYNYAYNELGWLTNADNTLSTPYDRSFYYNFLGNRDSIKIGTNVYRYNYSTTPGSSQLIGFNGGAQSRFYDEAGNLYQDNNNNIYQMDYEYRNMINYARVKEFSYNGNPQELYFDYDEGGMRIYKKFHYAYKAPCDWPEIYNPPTTESSSDSDFEQLTVKSLSTAKNSTPQLTDNSIENESVGMTAGGITYCEYWTTMETHYLYDGGSLVMTFDKNDTVEQYYVQGVGTNVAVYPDNNSSKLVYQITDHLGSTRLLINESGNVQYYAFYLPFGDILDEWSVYDEPLKYTGKEYDRHSTFEFYYYGARYYDPGLGRFTSVDKSFQFASGYVYGNNPIIGVDTDGYWFGIDDLIVSAVSFTVGYLQHGFTTGDFGWDAVKAGGIAAASSWLAYNTGGTAAGLISKEGSATYAITSATVGGAVGGATGAALHQWDNNQAIGGRGFWSAVVSGAAGGLAGGITGQYITTDPIAPSFIGGGVGGGVQSAYNHTDIFLGIQQGMFYGGLSGALTYTAYDLYGNYITNKTVGDGYGTDLSKRYVSPEELNLEFLGQDYYDVLMSGSDYSCKNFYADLVEAGYSDIVTFGSNDVNSAPHVGIDIGGNNYGQRFILSKQGADFPIRINTSRQLSTGRWANPYNGVTSASAPFDPAGAIYGPPYYQ